MKSILRTLAHGFVSAFALGATAQIQSGAPITSGAVLIPAAIAGVLGAIHGAMPSSIQN